MGSFWAKSPQFTRDCQYTNLASKVYAIFSTCLVHRHIHLRGHSREMKHGSDFPFNEKKETVTKGIKTDGVNGSSRMVTHAKRVTLVMAM